MSTGNAQDAWDEALARLLAYLTAMDIAGLEHRMRLAVDLVTRARENYDPAVGPPVEAVMDLALKELTQWFAGVLPPGAKGRELATGLMSFRVVHAASRWPDAVLSGSPPEELRAALAAASWRTGPDLSISSMTPRSMNYGAMESLAQETWHQFAWAPILRAAAIWTAIFFATLYAWERIWPQ